MEAKREWRLSRVTGGCVCLGSLTVAVSHLTAIWAAKVGRRRAETTCVFWRVLVCLC